MKSQHEKCTVQDLRACSPVEKKFTVQKNRKFIPIQDGLSKFYHCHIKINFLVESEHDISLTCLSIK